MIQMYVYYIYVKCIYLLTIDFVKQVYQTNFKNYSTSNDSYIIFYELEPLVNMNNTNVENKTSTVTSTSTCKPSVNGFFSSKF